MTETDNTSFLKSSADNSQDKHCDFRAEHETQNPRSVTGNDNQSSKGSNEISVVASMLRLMTQICPWLNSKDEFKKSFHKIETSIKERPVSSILYGLIVVLGFIPFAGFILLVSGSFAVLFTWFIFCQFFAVLFSALLCTGIFWVMLCSFVMLAAMLGGVVHLFMLGSFMARHANRLAQKLTDNALQYFGIPEADLPGSPNQHQQSEE